MQSVVELANLVLIQRCIIGSKVIVWCVVCNHNLHEFCCQAKLRTKYQYMYGLAVYTHNVVSESDRCVSQAVAFQSDL